ncbi:hypothetical protein J6590_081042 [Homalodisca vitripennis]|nr:hypothetical protein J6590_081042 [Homalodisca vitripennis]
MYDHGYSGLNPDHTPVRRGVRGSVLLNQQWTPVSTIEKSIEGHNLSPNDVACIEIKLHTTFYRSVGKQGFNRGFYPFIRAQDGAYASTTLLQPPLGVHSACNAHGTSKNRLFRIDGPPQPLNGRSSTRPSPWQPPPTSPTAAQNSLADIGNNHPVTPSPPTSANRTAESTR